LYVCVCIVCICLYILKCFCRYIHIHTHTYIHTLQTKYRFVANACMCMYFLVNTYIIQTAGFTYIQIQTCRVPDVTPDLRCTLQLRVGMSAARGSPMENDDSIRIPGRGSTCRGSRGSRHLMRMRSSVSMRTIKTTIQRELSASTAHSRLIYVLGDVKGADREDSKVSIDRLNYHPGIQKQCGQLERAGFKYL
jgi:hypothetical protein